MPEEPRDPSSGPEPEPEPGSGPGPGPGAGPGRSPDPREPELDPEPSPESCAEVQALAGRFAREGLRRADALRLREHLVACEACREVYRDMVGTAATLGRAVRRSRLEEARRQRRSTQRTLAVRGAMESPRVHRRRSWSALKLVWVPAILLFGFSRLDWDGPTRHLTLAACEGEVRLGQATLHAAELPIEVERGEWLFTPRQGGAELVGEELEVLLAESTLLLLEDAAEPRLRLDGGVLRVEGACRIATPLGLVECEEDSAVTLSLVERVLRVECTAGVARLRHPLAVRTLEAGDPPFLLDESGATLF